jgi:hypothetical protein
MNLDLLYYQVAQGLPTYPYKLTVQIVGNTEYHPVDLLTNFGSDNLLDLPEAIKFLNVWSIWFV